MRQLTATQESPILPSNIHEQLGNIDMRLIAVQN